MFLSDKQQALLERHYPLARHNLAGVNDEESFREHDSPLLFERISEYDQDTLFKWCRQLMPAKKVNRNQSSMNLKHYFENDSGIYVPNGAFKGAMLVSGFEVWRIKDLNWYFKIEPLKRHI
jgi:hypothetical protein